jgi:hypothetical protein
MIHAAAHEFSAFETPRFFTVESIAESSLHFDTALPVTGRSGLA